MVVVVGDGIRVTDPQWVTWSSQLPSAVALGPVSSRSLALDELAVITVSFGVTGYSLPFTIRLGTGPFA